MDQVAGKFGITRRSVQRGMTISDLLVLVAGFAVAFSLSPMPGFGGPVFLFGAPPIWFMIGLTIAQFILWFAIATAGVVYFRCFKYAVMPRAAEWLAVIIALWACIQVIPNVDDSINFIHRITGESGNFGLWRWTVAAASAGIAVAVSSILYAAWNSLAPPGRTLLLSGIGVVLLWGMLPVFAMQFDALLPPLAGLGDGWVFWLLLSIRQGIGMLPYAFLFVLPATATYFSWRCGGRHDWAWTERAGAGTAAILGCGWLMLFFFGSFEWPSTGWIAQRIVMAVGLVVTTLVSAWLVGRCKVVAGMSRPGGSS